MEDETEKWVMDILRNKQIYIRDSKTQTKKFSKRFDESSSKIKQNNKIIRDFTPLLWISHPHRITQS